MSLIKPETPVKYLNGVGPKRAQQLARLGIKYVGDLLYHFPRGYQHRGNIKLLSETADGEVAAFLLTISTEPKNALLKGRMTLTKFLAFDDSRQCIITYFNQGYVKDIFKIGATFRFWGKLSIKHGRYELTSPSFEPYYEGISLPEFVPLYPLTKGITQKYMAKIIEYSLARTIDIDSYDIIPANIREIYHIPALSYSLNAIHRPTNYTMMEKGRRRFVFEELFTFALGITITKSRVREGNAPVFENTDMEEFYSRLPFVLTRAQQEVINDITGDVTNTNHIPMARLVAGDVGSGKTVCAAAAVYMTVKNGYQSALMAPTEILAQQHYNDLKELFDKLGIKTALLTGSTTAAEKKKIKSELEDGIIDFVIGTHALITENVVFKNPGLFITDEQHRFGVMQRASLAQKGKDSHVLVMSATPIPRTLALILYGDLDISTIDEMPPGRQKVGTFLVDESYRERLNGFIRKQAEQGRQIYIVCPMIESSDDTEEEGGEIIRFDYGYETENTGQTKLKSAVDYAASLQNEIFPDLSVAFIHGRLKSAEKEKIMSDFAANKIQILVSTTVIEVGVNVPNATLMIVENAERFGLSQLHQLRGRVGRGKYKSWCILVSDTRNERSRTRLEVMTSTNDGYKIAEKDLEIRGPGDFFPTQSGEARQHGGFKFKLASLCEDMEQLKDAFSGAAETLRDDPTLSKPENQAAKAAINKLFDLNESTFN